MTRETDLEGLLAEIARRTGRRGLVALAGPPGAGKSTLAEALVGRLNAAAPGSAAVLPMDGYHLDDWLLNARGWRARKGAPHTFDLGGFAHMLRRLRANDEDEVLVPVFDRSIEIARGAARAIPKSVRHVIVEGNYLLLDAPGWRALRPLFDLTVMIEVPESILRRRLEDRWHDLTGPALTAKMEGNDLPNMALVLRQSLPADLVLRNG